MHDAVSVVIPGAINSNQIQSNCEASDLQNIDDKMPLIKKIYDELIKGRCSS